jgi:hypothetical protein
MVSKEHELSQRRQCALLQLSRSTLYCRPRGESAENLRFMEIIDKQFLETPWYGSRQMARHMKRKGHKCGRRHAESVPLARRVRRLMRLMRVRREISPPGAVEKARSGRSRDWWGCATFDDREEEQHHGSRQFLEVHGDGGQQSLDFHVFEPPPDGSGKSVECLGGAVRALDPPAVAGVDRAFVFTPRRAFAAGA